MSSNIDKIATEVRKIVKGTGYRLEMFSEDGNKTLDDRIARRFFLKPSNVMITLDEQNRVIKLHKPDSVEMNEINNLRKTLQNISNKNRWNFDFRTFGHTLKPKDYVHQAIKSMNDEELAMKNMAEGMSPMSGSSKSSYQLTDNKVKLIVRHTKPIDEEVRGSRSRHIKALFIENGAGERFQYPHKHLAGARAMARHVSMGGTTHDEVGSHISGLSEEYAQVQKFLRYARSPKFVSEETTNAVDAVKERYNNIREQLASLTSIKQYGDAVEAIDSTVRETTDEKVTELKDMFTTRVFPESLEDSLPLISKIIEYRVKAQPPVGDQLKDIDLLKSKAQDAEFHTPTAGQDEYSSANIMKFASVRDEISYKVRELSAIIKDDLLSAFLSRAGEKMQDEGASISADEVEIIKTVMQKAGDEGLFAKKAEPDAHAEPSVDDENPVEMPDDMYAPEGKQFESWLEEVAGDKSLFETVSVSEDEFVDFNRAVADAKERMAKLPRMADGSPLIRKIKGMCEEIATEYDVKSEDIYSALSGEEVINEGEPRQYKGDGTDAMVVKDGEVKVIDAEELDSALVDGWELAEANTNEAQKGEATTHEVDTDIQLAGDSIWMDDAETPVDSVHVNTVSVTHGFDWDDDDEYPNALSVYVEHDGPYEIYTDTGFEKAISQMIGQEVRFSEQGMQEDGLAHLEGEHVDKAGGMDQDIDSEGDPFNKEESVSDELGRVKHLAGVDPVIEDNDTDDEEPIEEAQSEAQKAAFQKMLDAKNGKKEETTEDADAEEEVDESKSSGDAWYAEQRAKEAYEKETGKRWKDLKYGHKEDWRKKFPAKTESVDELDRVKHLAGI